MYLKKISLNLAIVAAVLLCACNAKQTNMKYRQLGSTGIMVSELGLGCEAFGDKDAEYSKKYISIAIDSGVNYIDIYTSDPIIRDNIGYALKGRREKMNIQGHIGTIWENGQYKRTRNIEEAKSGFEDLLTRLNTDYIEVGMIHYVDADEDWENILNSGLMTYVQELKAEGKIKHIGIASHNPEVALKAVESGLIEVLMFSINPAFDLLAADANIWDTSSYQCDLSNINPTRAKLYQTCEREKVGISVMKVFGGGRLLDENQSALEKALTPCQCINYALSRPGVATALIGARTIDELLASLHFNTATAEEKDYATVFLQMGKATWKGDCIYCGHCAPCPVGIDVAKVTKLLNIATLQGKEISQSVIDEYKALEHKAGECTQCGGCESRCPFAVSSIENMKRAKEVFGE